jgi:adenosylcobyric acid synthase
MIQGTSSSVGKSLLTAGLCRAFARRGVRVAPFKAQNMSNNAAVCADGAEIGRAQAVQATAAGVDPTADMNPVLLKPEADARSQVVVLGRHWQTLRAATFYRRKEELWPVVTAALDRLRSAHDLVLIEGAGSPVELNLRALDIINMAVARHARAPVLLVGDIDRGGIFAQLLGTLWLLEPGDRALVRGLVVNRFRGDRALFADGVRILEERGGVPVLGVVPYLKGLTIPEEDAVALDVQGANIRVPGIDVAVVRLPHIANFDDFDSLREEPGVGLRYAATVEELGRPHAVILPGTKSTVADLEWLRSQGLAEAIQTLAGQGVAVVGICGGYQMLGRVIRDPQGVESGRPATEGLGLLPIDTVFGATKATYQVQGRVRGGPGWLGAVAGREVEGYEIHLGVSDGGRAWLEIARRNDQPAGHSDGAVTEDGRVWGCYLHGLFANTILRRAWLDSLKKGRPTPVVGATGKTLNDSLGRLADAVEAALDMNRLESILQEQGGGRP